MSDWRPLDGPLAAQVLGEGERIAFCHGFTQTAASWKPIAARFATLGFQTVVVDLPGHGGSAGVRADLRLAADLLAATCGRASYVGYSMGGRLCLQTALIYPNVVRRLALIGASPGIADEAERMRRIATDAELASRIVNVGIDTFLDEWIAQPLFGSLPDADDDLAERRTNTVQGLAASLRLAGTGALVSVGNRLAELAMPVLVMAGERDTKFTAIGRQVATSVQRGMFESVAAADHAAHLQRPEPVVALLGRWMRSTA